jgi:hypothetical protein
MFMVENYIDRFWKIYNEFGKNHMIQKMFMGSNILQWEAEEPKRMRRISLGNESNIKVNVVGTICITCETTIH